MTHPFPHCYVCKKEGDCSKGTMKVAKVDENMGIYLCPEHYENKEEVISAFWKERKKK